MRKALGALGLFLFSATLWALPPATTQQVREDLNFGRADAALHVLDPALAQNPADAEAHDLRCQVHYEEEQWDTAIADCEAAVQLAPESGEAHLWLGRAYGRKAAHGSLVAAYRLARKVHMEFETAARLEPHDGEVLADLGEFDVEAPAVVGGGLKSAEGVLVQLRSVDPVRACTLQAQIAEEKKDYVSAEAAYKAAVAQAHDPAGQWIDLARFYQRRGRMDDMLRALHTAVSLDREHGPALVEAAALLSQTGQGSETAIAWLREYLNSHAQSDQEPAFAVRAQLAKLLAMEGNQRAAQEQLAAVHALASGYRIPPPASGATAGE